MSLPPPFYAWQFGSGFLSKFECAQCDNRLLEEITLVDTPGGPAVAAAAFAMLYDMPSHAVPCRCRPSSPSPHMALLPWPPALLPAPPPLTPPPTAGVLSGEKQRVERAYDFIQVCSWFAARCDLILLLFDPAKLDISDEFKAVRVRGIGCAVQSVCSAGRVAGCMWVCTSVAQFLCKPGSLHPFHPCPPTHPPLPAHPPRPLHTCPAPPPPTGDQHVAWPRRQGAGGA